MLAYRTLTFLSCFFATLSAETLQRFTFPNAEPNDLDPHVELSRVVIGELFEGLVARDPKTMEPIPAVAEKWTRSSDGKKWTFTLRKDARWSNGDPVTAEDFVYSWARLLAPSTAAFNAYYAFHLKNGRAFNRGEINDPKMLGVKAPAPYLLSVELEHPIPFFLELLDTPPFFPVHRATVERFKGLWTRPGNIVSNGPFALQEWSLNRVILLKPNPHYWDRGQVKLSEVRVLSSASEKTNENMFRAKQIDLLPQIPQDSLTTWKADKNGVFQSEPMLSLSFLVLNTKRPPLNDKRVRQALSLAIDRARIVKYVTLGDQEPAGAFCAPVGTYHPVSRIPVDGTGIAKAKGLLSAAGYGPGKEFPSLTLRYSKNDNTRKLVEAIQEMWHRNLGITVKLQAEEHKVLIATLSVKDFDIAASGWRAEYTDPSAFLDLWMTGAGNNDAAFSQASYDDLLARATAESSREKRADLFHRAEEILLEEMPAIPLYFGRRNYLLGRRVRGWYPNGQNVHLSKYLTIEASPE